MRTTSSNYCKLGATALAALLALGAGSASAQISDDVVRVGIQGDMSGPYSGNGGPGSVLAARMAVEDFGGKVNGKADRDRHQSTTRTSRTSA
jgi:branched-chain amino acid transport system substrate-binding protein